MCGLDKDTFCSIVSVRHLFPSYFSPFLSRASNRSASLSIYYSCYCCSFSYSLFSFSVFFSLSLLFLPFIIISRSTHLPFNFVFLSIFSSLQLLLFFDYSRFLSLILLLVCLFFLYPILPLLSSAISSFLRRRSCLHRQRSGKNRIHRGGFMNLLQSQECVQTDPFVAPCILFSPSLPLAPFLIHFMGFIPFVFRLINEL